MQTPDLMLHYVDTVNRSIEENRDDFPYKQLFDLTGKMAEEIDVQVAVYKDDPKMPHDFFTLTWNGKELELSGHGKDEDTDIGWKVPQTHLEEVVTAPADYIKHPGRLNLDWLGRRFGLA